MTQLDPWAIPEAEKEHSVEYYEKAFLVARGPMALVQMPRMTNWLRGLSPNEIIELESNLVSVMQNVFTTYRTTKNEPRANEISKWLEASVSGGLSSFSSGPHMELTYVDHADPVKLAEMDQGYVEIAGNNLDDWPGDSLRIAFLAGIGALAFQAERSVWTRRAF